MNASDGSVHEIDLHWQVLSAPVLATLLPVSEALAESVPLKQLAPFALALSRPHAMLLACIHRAKHFLSPYYVDGVAYHGGDRLIWLVDIDLLARVLTDAEWEIVVERARDRGVALVCLMALDRAEEILLTPVPGHVRRRLAAAPVGPATRYLLRSGRLGRAFEELHALVGLRALGFSGSVEYLRFRLFPPADLVKLKYGGSDAPLPVLYLRRLISLFWRDKR